MKNIITLKNILYVIIILTVIQFKFKTSAEINLIISFLFTFGSFIIFKIQSIKAFKLYAYFHIITFNIVLLTNEITKSLNFNEILTTKLIFLKTLFTIVNFGLLILGFNKYNLLGLRDDVDFNPKKILIFSLISSILLQLLFRLL